MLVTSRPAGLKAKLFAEFHLLRLRPLTEAQQEQMVRQRVASPLCNDLIEYMGDNAPLDTSGLRATGNPLMLSMYISLFISRGGAMPENLAELYKMASKAMLDRVDRKERGAAAAGSSALSLESLLQTIFFEAHVAEERIIDEEQLLSAALGKHDPTRLKAVRVETAALPHYEGPLVEGHIVEVTSDKEELPFKGRRGRLDKFGSLHVRVYFPDGTKTGLLKADGVKSSGLDQDAYDQYLVSSKQSRVSLLRGACSTLPDDLSDALSAVRERVAQDRLPLLSLVQAEPLQVQSSHLSFQEFYAARAICSGRALSGPLPWQWGVWWANVLRLGDEMGSAFEQGLLRAAGVEGHALDLCKRVGGDRATACQAVTILLKSGTLTQALAFLRTCFFMCTM